jgi:hypothetical protein
MNPSDPTHLRPEEHERLIAKMQEFKPPPADAETPALPDDLLRRLQDKYNTAGTAEVVTQTPQELPDEVQKPKLPDVQPFRFSRQIAVAAAVVLFGSLAVMMLQPERPEEIMRGGGTAPAVVQVYWMSKTTPPPSGLGMPTFIVSEPGTATPPNALICDPVGKTATYGAKQVSISDPSDSEEWLAAIRQLSQ